MNLLEEIHKARAGKSSRVKLGPVPEEDLASEKLLREKGYKLYFESGFNRSRKEAIESLPSLIE